jgi:hypothetical protein
MYTKIDCPHDSLDKTILNSWLTQDKLTIQMVLPWNEDLY